MPTITHRLVILLLALMTAAFTATAVRADDESAGSGVGHSNCQVQDEECDDEQSGFSDGGDGHHGNACGQQDGFSDGGDGFSDGGDGHYEHGQGHGYGHGCGHSDGFSDGGDGYTGGGAGDPQVPPEGGDEGP